MCRRDGGGRGQRQSEVWRVDKDEETAMFGERRESVPNLYPANWKQQSPAPEPHSGPAWPSPDPDASDVGG